MQIVPNRALLFLMVGGFLIIFGCQGPHKSNREKISMDKLDSLRQVYYNINDSIQASWQAMMKDDNEKIGDMKRLLQEVRYSQTFDSSKMDSLENGIQTMEKIRYNQQTMATSSRIDRYDSITTALTDSIITYVNNHPKYDNYPYMEKLSNNILEANKKVLLYRIKYDNFVKKYNRFIEQHKGLMNHIDTSSKKNFDKKPLFQLGPS